MNNVIKIFKNGKDTNVTITASYYNQLLEQSATLDALEMGGVCDWQWYEASIEDNYIAPEFIS